MEYTKRVYRILENLEKELRRGIPNLTQERLEEMAIFLTTFVEALRGFTTLISSENEKQVELNPLIFELYKIRFRRIGDYFLTNLITLKNFDSKKVLKVLKEWKGGEEFELEKFFEVENILKGVKVVPNSKLDYFQICVHEKDAKKLGLNERINKFLIKPLRIKEASIEIEEEIDINNLLLKNSNMLEVFLRFDPELALQAYEKGEFSTYFKNTIKPLMRLLESELAGYLQINESLLPLQKKYYYEDLRMMIEEFGKYKVEIPTKVYLKDKNDGKLEMSLLYAAIFGIKENDLVNIEVDEIVIPGKKFSLRAKLSPNPKEPNSLRIAREFVEHGFQIDTKGKKFIILPYLSLRKKGKN